MNNDKKIAAREEAVEKTRSPLGIRIAKYVTAFAVVLVLFWFGCTCEVREGETAVILRFGAVREEITDAGLYFKLPWPFETSVTYDGRVQYLETGDLETMTKDKRNIVVRSFVTWEVADPVLYHNSVGFNSTAEQKLNSQVFNATNSTLGTYNLTNLVSLDQEEIKIDQIQNEIYAAVREVCLENYGIRVTDVSFLLFSLPDATLESVFEQMQAERQKEIDIILANAYLKANDITTEADAEAWNSFIPSMLQRGDLPFDAPRAETAGHENAVVAVVKRQKDGRLRQDAVKINAFDQVGKRDGVISGVLQSSQVFVKPLRRDGIISSNVRNIVIHEDRDAFGAARNGKQCGAQDPCRHSFHRNLRFVFR